MVAGNSSFVEKQIKRITVEDPKERFKLKAQEAEAKLAARGISAADREQASKSPGLKPSLSKVLEKRINEEKNFRNSRMTIKKKKIHEQRTMDKPLRMS